MKIIVTSGAGLLFGLALMAILTQLQGTLSVTTNESVLAESKAALQTPTVEKHAEAVDGQTLSGILSLAATDPPILLKITSPIMIGLAASLIGFLTSRGRSKSWTH